MAKGEMSIEGLNSREHKAAMAAVKMVRGDTIHNAYLEGWTDGYYQGAAKYRGALSLSDKECWEKSHTNALHEPGAE